MNYAITVVNGFFMGVGLILAAVLFRLLHVGGFCG